MAGGVAADRRSTTLPAPALQALQRALDEFEPRTRARGREYVRERRVLDVTAGGDVVTATVQGSEIYEVEWWLEDGRWTSACSCPVGPRCKHAYAVAWTLVRETLARPAAPPPPPNALRAVLEAHTPWERQQALGRLFGSSPYDDLGLHGTDLEDLLLESDAELLCWRLATLLGDRAPTRVRAELAPYRERPDLAARSDERVHAHLRHDLLAWAERARPAGERRLRLVLDLQHDQHGRIVVTSQARLTSHRLTDEPRTVPQLQQLRNEIRAHPWLLPPEETALLSWLTDGFGLGRMPSLREMVERFVGTSVLWWSNDLAPERAALGGVVPGAPVRLRAEPARLLPWCVARDGEAYIEPRFVWPDGTTRAPDQVLQLQLAAGYAGADLTRLVLADGSFSLVVEALPGALLEGLAHTGGMRIPAAERADVLSRLATRYPHVGDTVRAHTRFHRVTPAVVLDLRDDGWLALRIVAHDATGWTPPQPLPPTAVAFEYAPPGRWGRTAAPAVEPDLGVIGEATPDAVSADVPAPDAPAPVGDPWIDLPDLEAVTPAVAWLDLLAQGGGLKSGRPGLEEPAGIRPWWLYAGGRRLEALADAWEQRPPGVAFFGTERVRRLLTAPRAVPRIRVHKSGIDWLAVSADWEAEGQSLTDADLAALRSATQRFVKLPSSGEWVRCDVAAAHDDAARLLADLGLEAGAGEARVTLWQLAGARAESLAALERLGADPDTARAVQEMRRRVAAFKGLPRVKPPKGLRGTLRPYQRAGLDFLVHASSLGIGTVLADDMGLGKTVQALAWLEHLRAAEPAGGPSLVVCPASVMGNWAREAAQFVPGLRVLVLGRGAERHALRAAIGDHDLVVTNYALLRHDAEEWAKIELRAAILDEAQNVKNPDAVVTRAALALQARHRLALTGTPLENRVLDLWSIASVVNPGYLGTRAAFNARFDRIDAPPHARALLAAKLRPMLLRRLKRDVAPDLPERIEERRDCELTAAQRRLYLAELRRTRELMARLVGQRGGLERNRITILAALTRLRQLCCHPALGEGKAAAGSGKFDALFELLEPLLAEGHKVLVFSQFVRCLDLLGTEMDARGIRRHVLTGSTVRRDEVVAAFAADPEPCVFLLSLKAGGTGLNLTAASYVVLFDPWWNPAVEAQAIDRTHRIGQDRTVIAYRLVAKGTIEERILALQEQKAAMVRDVLGEDGFARAITRDDLEYLLGRE